MTAQEMWRRFGAPDIPYEAWAFGDDADALAQLVLQGIKTGTSSAHPLYALAGEPLPQVGDHSVVLSSQGEAVCVIRNVDVRVLPFRDVSETDAWKEGERDRSLASWRQIHERFFQACMAEVGLSFSEDMLVVYEEFEKIYP